MEMTLKYQRSFGISCHITHMKVKEENLSRCIVLPLSIYVVASKSNKAYVIYTMFAFTLHGNPLQWLVTLPKKYIHSFGHFFIELSDVFHKFECHSLNKKILKLRKTPDESFAKF